MCMFQWSVGVLPVSEGTWEDEGFEEEYLENAWLVLCTQISKVC